MKSTPNNALERAGEHATPRVYTVTISPRTGWGRAILLSVVAILLSFAFVFLSLLVAIGLAFVAFVFVIAVSQMIAKAPPTAGSGDHDAIKAIDPK